MNVHKNIICGSNVIILHALQLRRPCVVRQMSTHWYISCFLVQQCLFRLLAYIYD